MISEQDYAEKKKGVKHVKKFGIIGLRKTFIIIYCKHYKSLNLIKHFNHGIQK